MNKTHHTLQRPNLSQFSGEEISSIQEQSSNTYNQKSSENINSFKDEIPLLEDLGIDLNSVKSKLMSTLFFLKPNSMFIQKPDMTGPLLLGTFLGILLTLSQKLSFGFIYGFGFFGSLCIYFICNLMLDKRHLSLYNLMSILGYCISPILFIAFFNIFLFLKNFLGLIFAFCCAFMSTFLVLRFLGTSYDFTNKKLLFGYPIFLFYFTFVLIIIS